MAGFSRAGERLEAEGIKVVAASTDPEDEAVQSIEAGKMNISLYSSGPLGRLVWQDVIQAVQFRKKRMAAQAQQ